MVVHNKLSFGRHFLSDVENQGYLANFGCTDHEVSNVVVGCELLEGDVFLAVQGFVGLCRAVLENSSHKFLKRPILFKN